MELDSRKKQILAAIVDNYIKTAEPVGSVTIAKNYGIHLSSATIRNEMADLESMGYLDKPHTSAGRIPSSLGYRLYVEHLMNKYSLTKEETQILKKVMQDKINGFDDIVFHASDALSAMTNYITVATACEQRGDKIESFEIIPIGYSKALLVVTIDDGKVKSAGLNTENMSPEYIALISRVLSAKFEGRSPFDLEERERRELQSLLNDVPGLYREILDNLYDWLRPRKKVHLGGMVNIFNHPEYRDFEKAKKLLGFVEKGENVNSIMSDDGAKIKITIGDENVHEELKNCSVVIAHYNLGGKIEGDIGIIGPCRMYYSKVVSSLSAATNALCEAFGKLL